MPANNLMLMTARARAAASTYLMARRQLLAPPLMSVVAGTWVWDGDAACFGGGDFYNSSAADADEITQANVRMPAGTIEARALTIKSGVAGIADYRIGTDEIGSLDGYGTLSRNSLQSAGSSQAATSGLGRIVLDGKNASSSAYRHQLQFAELVKTSDGNDWGSGPEDLPWYQDIPPWFMGGGTMTWAGTTASEFGGYTGWNGDATSRTLSIFCPATAEYQLVCKYPKYSSTGIVDVAVDGGSVLETIDLYSASTVFNQSTTVDLGELSAGWHTVTLTVNGKNASSSSYNVYWSWFQLQRTTTGTCPPGVNGPEQVLLLPVFADRSSGWGIYLNSSQSLYGYLFDPGLSVGDYLEFDVNLKAGTWEALVCGPKDSFGDPAALLKLNGSTEDTLNLANGSLAWNQVTTGEFTVSTSGKNVLRLECATAGKAPYCNSILIQRTGD